eukprot:CAMPEP_0172328788 /NCGR_PEP_ID=MMETSP1058-20130122/60533_1 /TAXON_ID=83371 /ORGANISM="Detonula confervacea, Strain CCMP 353" /LENGTH=2032 /DNA_ID=CAMNT_0013045917 /DNA_START=48 /DNA_END=6146 /DNA_ORIENTATION=-
MSDSDSSPPTRHRADDDMEALASGSFAPPSLRTPNGDADLLSGEAASVFAAAAPVDAPSTPFSIDGDDDDDDNYAMPHDPSAAATGKKKGNDPSGQGARLESFSSSTSTGDDASVCSSSSRNNDNTGKKGAQVKKLSDKTSKIMSDYQAYLAEIETEFPSHQDEDVSFDPSLAAARETVRDSYNQDHENVGAVSPLPPVMEDHGYATGAGEPLVRAWDYSRSGNGGSIVIDRTGRGTNFDDDVTEMTTDMEAQMLVRGQNYTHSWLQSKRIKRGIFMIVGAAVVIGVSVGVSKKQKSQKMDQLEGDMQASAEGGGGWDVPPEYVPEETSYKTMELKYKPLFYNRYKGWEGQTYTEALVFCGGKTGYAICPYEVVCPGGDDSEPLGGYMDGPDGENWIPVLDTPNEWVQVGKENQCIQYSHMHGTPPTWGITGENNEANTQNILCCLGDDLVEQASSDEKILSYDAAKEKYQPKEFTRNKGWEGQTFEEAIDFCQNIEGYDICPYTAICPLGPDTEPLGGAKGGEDESNEAWVPVLNSLNEWVQVGRGDMCIAYSHVHADGPDWGITGVDNELLTRNMICCRDQEEERGNEEAIMYQLATTKYHPHWFDRSRGWDGQTFDAALEFCESMEGFELCPYEALCPMGPGHEPLSAYQEGPFNWLPIIDKPNEWVQVSEHDACVQYSHINPNPPDWGLNGADDEEVTKYIMCCAKAGFVVDPNVAPPMHPTSDASGIQVAGPAPIISEEGIATYTEVAVKYSPQWFNRDKGWDGTTYLEALQFCSDSIHELCPLVAICPLGPDSQPLGGYREEVKGSWVPILDEDDPNNWVQVSNGENQGGACIKYSNEHEDLPEWGLTGEGDEGMTRHVACCLVQGMSIMETAPTESVPTAAETIVANVIEEEEEEQEPELEPAGMNPAYMGMATKYLLEWHSREKGWSGQTYLEALQYCAASKLNYDLCPLEAICPLGMDSEPLGGFKEEPNMAWVPILDEDDPNNWVQVSNGENQGGACIKYSNEHEDLPEWGLTGEGDEGMTRHVACCLVQGMSIMETAPTESVPTAAETIVANVIEEEEEEQEPELEPAGMNPAYMGMATKYLLEWHSREKGWSGQTYLEALQYCAASKLNYDLCPLEAICPLGMDSEPLGGFKEEPNMAWVPILDEDDPNNWVQVSNGYEQGGTCIKYSNEHEDLPEWGITGEGNEDITRHVACCLAQGMSILDTVPTAIVPMAAETIAADVIQEEKEEQEPEPEPAGMNPAYMEMAEKYFPEWHSRENGWSGQTYLEAVQYCADSKLNYDLCPIEAICPLGIDSEPLGGFKEEPNGAWVAISDELNDWVQVNAIPEDDLGETCLRYGSVHGDHPEWGITGEGNEDITRHVVCCLMQGTSGDLLPDETLPQSATPPAQSVMAAEEASKEVDADGLSVEQVSLVYKTASETYKPRWFDRTNGWNGRTFTDAFLFCSDFNNYMPCLYEAICPMGPHSMPLAGYKDEPNGSWAPLQDASNSWVQLGENASCVQYSHLHPGPPAWGVTGEDNEEITRHVACCMDATETPEPTERPTPEPTPDPTPLPTMEPTTAEPTSPPTNLPTKPPTSAPTPDSTPHPTYSDEHFYELITKSLEPIPFDRSTGWNGATYLEAIQFCANQNSRVPCPYIGYCPLATKNMPLGGAKEGVSWAPVFDAPNGWVQIGEEDTCQLYTELFRKPPEWGLSGKNAEDITRHIMCCLEEPEEPPEETATRELPPYTEEEQAVLDIFKPAWFGREEGYQGTTYAESAEFCNNVAGMELCPLSAYCPNGPADDFDGLPLYLQLPQFEGEQWAPIAGDDNNDGVDDFYVMIGTMTNNPTTTCLTYREFSSDPMPEWGLDGSRPELNTFLLCCKDPRYMSNGIADPAVDLSIGGPDIPDQQLDEEDFNVETAIAHELQPEWLDLSDGWLGGSHDDAEAFCDDLGGRQICPYAAYCPHGPGQPVSSGHTTDISAEGIQYSPVFGHENHWVMVGQKHGNSATTCFGFEDLEGGPPEWGLTMEEHAIKKHIMCCVVKR